MIMGHLEEKEPFSKVFYKKIDLTSTHLLADKLKKWAKGVGATHVCHSVQKASTFSPQDKTFFHQPLRKKTLESLEVKDLKEVPFFEGLLVWDSSSPVFVHEVEGKKTLCLPSFLLSPLKDSKDHKSALFRSLEKWTSALTRLLSFFHQKEEPFSFLEVVQEFFLTPQKNTSSFLIDLKSYLLQRGIKMDLKQKEGTCFSFHLKALSPLELIDQHSLTLDLIKEMAPSYGLTFFFPEKGCQRELIFSFLSSARRDLLDPKEHPLFFLILIVSWIRSLKEHLSLIKDGLYVKRTKMFDSSERFFEKKIKDLLFSKKERSLKEIEEELQKICSQASIFLEKEMLFEWGKGELRCSFFSPPSHLAPGITALYAVLADRLMLILDDLNAEKASEESIMPLLQEELLFQEEPKRECPFSVWKQKKSMRSLEGVLSECEIQDRYECWIQEYSMQKEEEAKCLIERFEEKELFLKEESDPSFFLKMQQLKREIAKRLSQIEAMGWEAKLSIFFEILEEKLSLLKKMMEGKR